MSKQVSVTDVSHVFSTLIAALGSCNMPYFTAATEDRETQVSLITLLSLCACLAAVLNQVAAVKQAYWIMFMI